MKMGILKIMKVENLKLGENGLKLKKGILTQNLILKVYQNQNKQARNPNMGQNDTKGS